MGRRASIGIALAAGLAVAALALYRSGDPDADAGDATRTPGVAASTAPTSGGPRVLDAEIAAKLRRLDVLEARLERVERLARLGGGSAALPPTGDPGRTGCDPPPLPPGAAIPEVLPAAGAEPRGRWLAQNEPGAPSRTGLDDSASAEADEPDEPMDPAGPSGLGPVRRPPVGVSEGDTRLIDYLQALEQRREALGRLHPNERSERALALKQRFVADSSPGQ